MDDSPLQTALCLIGHPIGGNPTQFVVTRALASMQLDWQFLSFDVQPDRFQQAIAGIDALGFFGAMIAAPYRKDVAGVLRQLYGQAPTDSTDINDSIFRGDDGKLVAVNLLATALGEVLSGHQQASAQSLQQVVCITDEEDPTEVLAQFQESLPRHQFTIRGSQFVRWPLLPPAIDTASTAEPAAAPPEVESPAPTDDEAQSDLAETTAEPVSEQEAEVSFDEQLPTLVVWQVNGKPGRKTTVIGNANLEFVKEWINRIPDGSLLVDLSCNHELWIGRHDTAALQVINRVDLKLRRLALAIQRWTGREPNFEMMREAIEEYLEI